MSAPTTDTAASTATRGPGERLGEIVIPRRFNGPRDSANGGYACGAVARFVGEPAEITLRLPPPLERPLAVEAGEGGAVRLLAGDAVVAEGRPLDAVAAEPPVRPSFDEATAATTNHPFLGESHQLSNCFVCGPERGASGDGLGVTFGALPGHEEIGSAPFAPDASVATGGVVHPEVVWAALDCPSYAPSMWGTDRMCLLGRLSAQRERDVRAGERLAAVGWSLRSDGRKHETASALLDSDGGVVARARATWIELRG